MASSEKPSPLYTYLDPGRNSQPLGEVNPTTGKLYFTHTDKLGTPQVLTDSTQAVAWSATYQPFGSTVQFNGPLATQSLRRPGQQFDAETGYNHNGFRNYAGTLTRYAEVDPIGLNGGMNTFQYVGGNPFKFTDRRGLDPVSDLTKQTDDLQNTDTLSNIWRLLYNIITGNTMDRDLLNDASQSLFQDDDNSQALEQLYKMLFDNSPQRGCPTAYDNGSSIKPSPK